MEKQLVVDGTGHVSGKLAGFVAKKLLSGYRVTVVATESICYTGPLFRHIGKYKSYRHKRSCYNPERGPFHQTQPSNYFTKVVRGMTPRKTKRGTQALLNLKCYEGIPKEFENTERVIVPDALLKVTSNCDRPFCTLGQLLSKFGWKHANLANKLTNELREREREAAETLNKQKKREAQLLSDSSFIAELNQRLEQFA